MRHEMLIRQMRCLLEQLRDVYDGLQDRNELAIYDKYGSNGKRFTIFLIRKKISNILFH